MGMKKKKKEKERKGIEVSRIINIYKKKKKNGENSFVGYFDSL